LANYIVSRLQGRRHVILAQNTDNITEMVGDAVIDVYMDHLVTVMPVDGIAELLF